LGPNVIILAGRTQRAEALRDRCGPLGRSVVATDDAYQAAVEILRSQSSVLVVDLSDFRAFWMGLIALARRRQATVLGAGPVTSKTPPSLGLEAVQMDDLPDRLAKAVAAPAEMPAAKAAQVGEKTPKGKPETEPIPAEEHKAAVEPAQSAPEPAAKRDSSVGNSQSAIGNRPLDKLGAVREAEPQLAIPCVSVPVE
jgi:hypothetical protein